MIYYDLDTGFKKKKKRDLPHTGLLDTAGQNLPNLPKKREKKKVKIEKQIMREKNKKISLPT